MTRFRTPATGKPEIIDGRYYIALRDPPLVLSVQPLRGFRDPSAAQRFLRTLVERSSTDSGKFTIAEAAQIDAQGA